MTDVCRHTDPATGDLALDPVAATWVQAPAPAVEQVAFLLGTSLGTCPLDPSAGVDWAKVAAAAISQRSVVARAAILAGLKSLVDDGTLTQLSVSVSQAGNGNGIAYVVTFVDPLAPSGPPQTIPGTVP